ncbi:hypothetical protein CR513_04419, partial [Mucuna pruriens]
MERNRRRRSVNRNTTNYTDNSLVDFLSRVNDIESNHSRVANSRISNYSARLDKYLRSNTSRAAYSRITNFSSRVENDMRSSTSGTAYSTTSYPSYASRVDYDMTSVASVWGSSHERARIFIVGVILMENEKKTLKELKLKDLKFIRDITKTTKAN